jgi:hypothetical protein
MAFWDLFKKPAADAAATLIGSVTTAIDEIVTNKEERETLKLQAQKQVQDYQIKIEQLAQESDKMYLDDKANARDMQKAALLQEDRFSKRFVYYLAIFWTVAAIVYVFLTTFFTVKNERVADTVLGFLLGTIIATIINFFFGSSKGSSDKQAIIDNLTKK